ncbi:membrane protein insertase YidC [Streptomyces lunaelactis]|uniref:Membrane protein insertase YidC n=2 Tax=Streptomyces lunaelactis TaxID=1535768 RepID=A0A2R4T4P4_9ACTN|nr:membrane protein insertase YidC [Streptomyces lunaelactis]AVZ74105.1 membrane protein insertase YidC [Streptomyces lunaelactis]NUK01265.1 membrane protein insertase YidC [Streptomyces lunaelactis]NUK08589.1 membrane protein insertase YidC [Streptomyces lunaelactis]NUK15237.1 membrane protein insertase YidC [Streptomyces lunaelactis]NUK25857.1 membrane protein insertase YidC [Streptomyces lunaelactis]
MDTIAGLFSFITTPVSWVIVQFHSIYGAIFGPDTGWAWGLSIVSLVILIRICLIPLFVKQIKSTRNMQALQPKMKAIQERYKNDKQRQSEEMMKLYKETGTNPLSSCLPILAQSPFFFALYHVLSKIASNDTIGVINESLLQSAQKAHIFGAPLAAKFTDSPEKVEALNASLTDVRIVTAIMIVMMSASQFYTQRQLMQKNVDLTVKTPYMQQQKMLMYIFPVIFAVMGINFPVGVLVYWLTTNVWTMGQQMFVINQNPTPGSKAQDHYLQRLLKGVTVHSEVRSRRKRNVVQAIVAKGPDRNENERRFITGLAKAGLAAQPDGTVVKSDVAVAEAEGGATPKRQQPKRQTKAKRQSGSAQQAAAKSPEDGDSVSKPSLQKDEPAGGTSQAGGSGGDAKSKPASGSARQQPKSGQRKGQQRPKHPSSKK